MAIGSIFAVIHGAAWPLLAIVFGSMTNTFIQQTQIGFIDNQFESYTTSMYQKTNVSLSGYNSSSVRILQQSDPYKGVTKEEFEDYMTTYALYYVFIGIGVFVTSYMQVMTWMWACERQVYRLRQEFFYEVLRKEIAWFDCHQTGELSMKLNDDLERVREGIGDKFSMFIEFSSTFIAGFIVGFVKSWELTLVIMSMTPLLALSSAFLGKLIATSTSREQQKYAVAGSIAEEVLSSIRTVIAFCGQKFEVERYTAALQEGKNVAIRKYFFMAIGIGFTFLVLYCSYALAFWYGSTLILNKNLDAGAVFTVFFAVMVGSFSLGNAIPHLTAVATAKGSAATVYDIIDTKPLIDAYSTEGIKLQDFKADIQFKNVVFNYPIRKTVKVLRNFSLSIQEGQTIALCGPSGSGKSTVVSLLLRFYDPIIGQIEIDGHNLKDLNVNWLRHIVGVVSQEPVLFGCTIAENIRYGRPDVTFHEIVAAAKMANVHNFIVSLPDTYDTLVGERGAQLSGGQKQRIAIARALVRDPKILLLDEATSALDAESEAIVQQALDNACSGRTTIIIAHRLSTIKNADVICAIENGQIMEKGTHEELMDKEGLYYQLVTNQMMMDETGYSTTEEPSYVEKSLTKSSRKYSLHRPLSEKDRHLNRLMSEVENEDIKLPSGWEIIKICSKEWKEIFMGTICSIIVGAVMPTFAVFYSEIFSTFTLEGEKLISAAFFWSMMFIVLAVISFIGYCFRTIGYAYSGEHLTMRLRQNAFNNILRQHAGWFDDEKHTSGKLATRLATDVPMVKSAAGHRIGTVVSAVVTLVTSIVIAFIFGWKLALALLASMPILLAAGAVQMKVQKGNQKRDAELMENAGNVVSESLENIRTVQSLNLQQTFFLNYVNHLLLPFNENKKHAQVYALAFAFSQGMIFLIYGAAFRLGAYFVGRGDMEAVNVYRVFFAMAFSAVSVGQWSSYLPDYTRAKLSAALVFNIINTKPEIDSYSMGGVRPKIKGEVTFKDVYFSYPSRKNFPVLRGLNLNVKPGQTVALVGPSGCGKSTIVSLIERFYDPMHGQVKIDDYDIRTMNINHLRSHIALVSQEPVLFNCSIRDNIVYGMEEYVSEVNIQKACHLANAHNFIISLPQGYDTVVGERGTQLSGGQKQRIAIARALVRNPKILLLDEATSALDTESEKLVQMALDQARHGRTCIVVAHRLSTIQGADCIVVIDHGRVTEFGSHEKLLEKKGFYYRLTKRQRIKH
ncbi:ATP-dependent translocase ABCB1-like [Centruroides vittatus]|uniref:ATP-dependent translocase ABCB1-like n=1 Tax=Centruroides vittatus TaxID=120091 RepID=UPI00350F1E52